jgi:Kdo2-lipid IVA lauroyltransferase/acyltransferase
VKKKIQHRLEFWLVLSLGFVLRLYPYRVSLFFANIIGDILFLLGRKRRKITLENLKRSFPDKDKKELKQIAKRAYRNIAKSLTEYMLFPKLDKGRILRLVEFEGLEVFDSALQEGKGAVLVTGHFGSWELMGAATSQKGYPIDFLVGEQHNRLVDNLMNEHRMMMGIGIIKMGAAAKGVIKALKENRFVAMLSDQDAGKDGTIVDFLGFPASTPKGPAAFSLKTNAPMIMGFIIRTNGKRQKIILESVEPIEKTSNKEEDIKRLTQAYTSVLEKYIRMHPDHWYWLHRRWKSTLRK